MTTRRRGVLVVGLIALVFAVSARAQERQEVALDVVVTSGEAVIKVAPDRAFVTVSAEHRARTPREAQSQNRAAMSAVQQKLAATGIADEAVRTLAIELSPEFDYANGRQTLRGYVARNSIEVRVDALERLGEVIDLAVGAGATSVSSVRFDVKAREDVERDALRQAVRQASVRAEAAAAGAGRTVARVVRIEDEGAIVPPPPRPMMMARAEMAAAEMAPTPVAPGEIEIRARVTLTAALK